MYHSESIITAIEANKILALKLEKALAGVKDNVVDNLKRMEKGAIRASYLVSCFTENYQDVCANIKHENKRFYKGIVQLVKDRQVIFVMIKIYIEIHLKNKSEDRIEKIKRKLIAAGFLSLIHSLQRILLYLTLLWLFVRDMVFNRWFISVSVRLNLSSLITVL